ncbi:hypothetical protein GIB67_002853 [Kingdonia uniflora]|uniref:KIB1-4 beta-propeller domain-containing protein n=1 Tax=Kingdonia uniflora TaxID=39325 RepID=A0A7J7M5A1_9MAGN|nr:hypothetical protein GIB67_002853 [Kingdonia uniflora]
MGPCKLAITKPGDECWASLEAPLGTHKDVIFYKGQFYALTAAGVLRICDVNSDHPNMLRDFASPPDDVEGWDTFYLMEMSGELHMVVRILEYDLNKHAPTHHIETAAFEVYKLDFSTRRWEELSSLGDYALFVGNNTSFAVSASKYSQLKGNSIYFTDDDTDVNDEVCDPDIGIFNFEETVEPICKGREMYSFF